MSLEVGPELQVRTLVQTTPDFRSWAENPANLGMTYENHKIKNNIIFATKLN